MIDNEDRVVVLLEELVHLTRFTARDAIERTMRSVLKEPRHLQAYELSDGTRTQTQVAQAVGLSQPAMSELWKKWRRLGLLHERGLTLRHLVRPSDLGWDVTQRVEATGAASPTRRIQPVERKELRSGHETP